MGHAITDRNRWPRRCVSVGGLLLLTLIVIPTAPLWVVLAVVVDLITGRTLTRAGLFFGWYLLLSVLGVGAAVGLWVVGGVWAVPSGRDVGWHHRLQRWWSAQLFRGLCALFRVSVEVEGGLPARKGPVIVLSRHVSTADTLLPMVVLANPLGWNVRYVLKRELLWDPCLDIVGQRVPNAFVRRGGADADGDLERVRSLTQHLGARDCIVLFPEGTRFTEARRQRHLERLAASGAVERLDHARALEHLLPMRTGGVQALLDGAPAVDVVFLAHVGLEGVTRMSTLVDGSLLGRRLQVNVRRVPARAVPTEPAARAQWLQEQWLSVDRWVGARRRATQPVEAEAALTA